MVKTEQIEVPILMYHRVVPDISDPSVECYRLMNTAVSQKEFSKQMRYIQANYKVIGLQDLVSYIVEKKPIPKNSCVITFDDNYKDYYLYVFPILKKLGFKATFFIESGHFADNAKIKFLDKYYYILDNSSLRCFDFSLPDGTKLESYPLHTLSKKTLVQGSRLKKLLKHSDFSTQREILYNFQRALKVTINDRSLSKKLYLSREEIAEILEAGMELGAHTINHPSLSNVDSETAR